MAVLKLEITNEYTTDISKIETTILSEKSKNTFDDNFRNPQEKYCLKYCLDKL